MADLPTEESHEKNQPTEQPIDKTKRGKSRWMWKLVIVLLLVVATIQLIFRLYSDEIVGRVLKEIVSIKSDQLYRIEYDDISFDLLGQQLEIDNFQLIPNRAVFFNEKNQTWKVKNSVFQASIPHIKLTGASVIDLYIKDILNINEFKVHGPNITAYIQPKDSVHRSKRLKINDLHFLIADRLNYFSVKELEVDRASVTLDIPKDSTSREKYHFQNITLSAINFLIDSASQQKDQRPFSVEDIHVQARYNLIKLPNTPYSLQFEDLELSTYAASFTVMGLRLTCDEDAKIGKGKFGNRNLADLYVPFMRATGVDYRNIYFDKSININNLILKKPEATIYNHKGQERNLVANAERTYKNISKQFKSIEIQKIQVDRGYFQYNQGPKEIFYVENASGELSHFLLDSLSHRERGKFFFLDDVNLNIKEYEFPFADNLHTLNAREINISTSQKKVLAKNLSITCPYSSEEMMKRDTSGDVQSFNVILPLIQFRDFDIKKLYAEKSVEANQIFLYQPQFDFFKHVADSLPVAPPDSLIRIKDLYPFVKPIFKDVRINDFYIKEGSGNLVRQYGTQQGAITLDTASIRLKNVQIDRYSKYRKNTFLNTHNIDIDITGVQMIRPDSLYQLDIGKLKAAQKDSSILLQNFHIWPKLDEINFAQTDSLNLPSSFIDVKFRELKLDSIDLTKAYYSGILEIDKLLLKKPSLKVFKNPQTNYEEVKISPHERLEEFIAKNFQSLSLNKIYIDSGDFALVDDPNFEHQRMALDSIGLYLNNLLIDSSTLMMPQVLFIMDTFQLDGKGYHLNLPDSIHKITFDQLAISSATKQSFVTNIQLIADSTKLTSKSNCYFAQIPEVRLKEFDPKLLYYDKILEADSLLIPSPNIQVALWETNQQDTFHTSSLKLENLFQLIKPTLKGIEIKHTVLDSGFVQLIRNGKGKGQTFQTEELDVRIDDFNLNESAQPTATRMLYSENVVIKARNAYHFLPDSTYTIHFGELGSSIQEGRLWAQQLNIHPLNQASHENYINAYIPDIQLDKIDFFQLYQGKGFHTNKLTVSAPWVKATTFPQAITKTFTLDSIYSTIKPYLPSIQVNQFKLEKGDFYLRAYNKLKPDNYHLGKVFLDVKNFTVDSTSSTKQKQFLSDVVEFGLKDYELKLPDSLHKVYVKSLNVNTQTSSATLDSIAFNPLFPKYQFAQKVGHETDRINFSIDKAFIKNIDLRKLLSGEAVNIQKLLVNKFDVTAFRNKSAELPQPENHRPKLPRQLLKELKLPLNLDTLEVWNSKVTYQEHAELGDTLGAITLNKMNVAVHNITNDPKKIEAGTSIDISTNFKLMNSAQVIAFFDMPLNSENGEYYFEGIVDSMDLRKMNPILEPVAYLKIRQGKTRSMRFKVSGNDKFATGIMRFKYKRLKVTVINKGFVSWLANTFLVIRNNPRRLIVRKGRMFYRRDTTRSVFNYWANTLLSGVRHTIGIKSKDKPDKEARKNILNSVVEKFKLEGREQRKAERERKRALREKLKKQKKEGVKLKDGKKLEDEKNQLQPDKNDDAPTTINKKQGG